MRYGVIGCGKMGFVILESLVSLFPNKHNSIFVSDIDQKKLSFIKKKFGIKITKSNFELTDVCDIIILSIKPQQMVEVLDEIKDGINKNKLIISIAAGIKLDFIKKIISKKVAIVRCMPNLPLKYGFGLTAFCANCYTSDKQKTFVKKLFFFQGQGYRNCRATNGFNNCNFRFWSCIYILCFRDYARNSTKVWV